MENIKGLKELLKKLDQFGEDGEKVVAAVTKATANELERNAKRNSPYDLGDLREGIAAIQIDKKNWKVATNVTGNAPYSAFIEFGTGGLVDVPAELQEIAIQFKGRGVKQININPQPYLYPAFLQARKEYVVDLEDGLQLLLNKV